MTYIIANWKMNVGVHESVEKARELVHLMAGYSGNARVVLCPSFLAMSEVAKEVVSGSRIALGAQDAFWEPCGAFTGDVSLSDLHDLGCRYVILGHSERRRYHRETNEEVNKKVRLCVQAGLNPILCAGETAEERRSGRAQLVIAQQVRECLRGVKPLTSTGVLMAYEPVWAIGSGIPATPHNVREAVSLILHEAVDANIPAENISMLYGGSVSQENVVGFLESGCRGLLVGGQSLEPKTFFALINEAGKVTKP